MPSVPSVPSAISVIGVIGVIRLVLASAASPAIVVGLGTRIHEPNLRAWNRLVIVVSKHASDGIGK
jgi:hypothetical protein